MVLYSKARDALKQGALCSGVTLNKRKGHWYATFVVDIPQSTPQNEGRKLGVDIGSINLLTTSEGVSFGKISATLKRRTDRAFSNRRKKQKLNACLKGKGMSPVPLHDPTCSSFVKYEIGRAINEFTGTLVPTDIVILEKLNVKGMRFKSHRMNRVLSASQIGYLTERLKLSLAYTKSEI